MKLALAVLTTFSLVSCSTEHLPTTPDPVPATAWIWAMAVEDSGLCIKDANFEIVEGNARVGEVIPQQTPCDAWAYDGGVMLRNLAPRVSLTLRAAAAGYSTVERRILPNEQSGQVDLFVLRRQ